MTGQIKECDQQKGCIDLQLQKVRWPSWMTLDPGNQVRHQEFQAVSSLKRTKSDHEYGVPVPTILKIKMER